MIAGNDVVPDLAESQFLGLLLKIEKCTARRRGECSFAALTQTNPYDYGTF